LEFWDKPRALSLSINYIRLHIVGHAGKPAWISLFEICEERIITDALLSD